ncbi:hypothetical protein WHR41_08844 [Cladosporium halotolerans]|uniref:Uncharacterized protein n=1 Tax=Cladosporium halotolerans TaxID=1052096 RepID=A0AB34KE89_9PEZI
MHAFRLLAAFFSSATTASAFRFHIWLGDKCTITGSRVSDTEILVFPERVDSHGCMKYDLYDWGHDQSLMVRPEDEDGPDQYLAFFNSDDCSGDPMVIMPPASILRERPVAGCSNYAAAGITNMSYKVDGV